MATLEQVEYGAEMRSRFQQFGTYANFTRGVPNVLDGLKPVQRRIIWAMYTMGAVPGKAKYKAMDCIGQTSRYHPHGDSAVYDTMANMAHVPSEGKPFKRPVPLIEGQGSWGDLLDGAAAPRYTECSLSEQAVALLGSFSEIGSTPEISENTVNMIPNYSGRYDEPEILPALWPHYLVNTSKGIGVGIASNLASHNLTEVLNLAIKMVDTPNPRMETIRSIMPGPDMPCDADIFDNDNPEDGIEAYYQEGRGGFTMRARLEIEEYQISARKKGHRVVAVTLPYQVDPEHVVQGISDMVYSGDLPADVEVNNFSNIKGIRVAIDVKENDPEDIIRRVLYYGRRSGLQRSFYVNSNAIVDGKVRTVGILEALRYWINHRRTVVRRRSRYRMDRANERLEIVMGLLQAIPIADKIVEMIRQSDNRQEAEKTLQEPHWGFTPRQATAILDMTLSQLTKLSTDRYLDEKSKLEGIIDECKDLLDNPASLDTRLKKEMRQVRDEFGYDRRCTIQEGSAYVDPPETPAVEIPAINGYLIRTGKNWVRWANRTTVNNVVGNDYVTDKIRITDGNRMDGISNMGWHYRIMCGDLPEKMTNANALFPAMDPGENLVLADTAAPYGEGTALVVIAEAPDENPVIKRIEWDNWASLRAGKQREIIPLEEGWSVTQAFFLPPEGYDIGIISGYGKMLKMEPDAINPKGRAARGNPVMKLNDESDTIIWAGAVKADQDIVYWNTESMIGWFNTNDVEYGNRNTQGQLISRSDYLIAGVLVGDGSNVNWFGSGMEEPKSVSIDEQPGGTKLTDKKMAISAPGITKSNARWIS